MRHASAHTTPACPMCSRSSIQREGPWTSLTPTSAPLPVAVVDGEIKKVSLSDYKGKYVVLFFYPKDFTFVCPTEIIAFSGEGGMGIVLG